MKRKTTVLVVALFLIGAVAIAAVVYIVSNWTNDSPVSPIAIHASNMVQAIEAYHNKVGCIPKSSRKIVKELCGEGQFEKPILNCENGWIKDVWGNDYRIDIVIILRSAGEDGKLFTDDDEVSQCELDQ